MQCVRGYYAPPDFLLRVVALLCFVSNECLEYLRLHQHYEASRACPESR